MLDYCRVYTLRLYCYWFGIVALCSLMLPLLKYPGASERNPVLFRDFLALCARYPNSNMLDLRRLCKKESFIHLNKTIYKMA